MTSSSASAAEPAASTRYSVPNRARRSRSIARRTGASSSTARIAGLAAMAASVASACATLRAMVWVIVGVLVFLWFLGFLLRAAGGFIHLLLIVALVIVIYRLLTGRRVL